ncbi:DUF1311 domain-containing protein [Aeromonas jandaei]|uniref:lysozyme inhibitor LprI family protein n=1 Tax=Aeromonas jandaei TaxID=650 RepID=UPI001F2AA89B|nr:lysozyme inhibitor LprI family protein [Aeromonas jandaei]MCF7717395.1 DUF1311 domain-containing protein [Aeromonas jandaei]
MFYSRIMLCLCAFWASLSVFASPSFDCGKAESSIEKMICSDKVLSELDSSLSTQYKYVLKTNPSSASSIKDGQRTWLRERKKCTDNSCLISMYEKRIKFFHDKGNAKLNVVLSPPNVIVTLSGQRLVIKDVAPQGGTTFSTLIDGENKFSVCTEYLASAIKRVECNVFKRIGEKIFWALHSEAKRDYDSFSAIFMKLDDMSYNEEEQYNVAKKIDGYQCLYKISSSTTNVIEIDRNGVLVKKSKLSLSNEDFYSNLGQISLDYL